MSYFNYLAEKLNIKNRNFNTRAYNQMVTEAPTRM